MKTLDLRSLHVFTAVCEKGNMTAAAETLGMTQSAVSQHIKQIEEYVGTALLDRSLRPLQPTPAGVVLYERGRALLAETEEVRLLAQQSAVGSVPLLRIGVIYSLSREYVSELTRSLLSQPRPPSLSIWTALDLDQGRALLNRELDVVITADTLEDVDGLERHEIVREPFLLIVPATYATEGAHLDLRKLAGELPMVRYSARSLIGVQVERHLRRLRIVPPRQLEFDSSDAVVSVVGQGRGWALMTPLGLLHSGGDYTAVRPLKFPGPRFGRRLTLIARERELAQFPEQLARLSRDIVRRIYLPKLVAIRDWLREEIEFGPDQ